MDEEEDSSSLTTRSWALAALLVAIVFLAYAPCVTAGWIWDDDSYVTKNPLLRPEMPARDALRLIWQPGATPQYYPIVFTSFLLESRLYGVDEAGEFAPLGFHLVNIALHATSAVLLWRILRRLPVPGCWLAAALFAVHPMNVESVAWVTERKNVLALAFGLAATLSWLRATHERSGAWTVAALILFTFGMLSKTTIAAVAPALVLIHLWRRDRLPAWQWLALAGFFAIGIPLGLHTAHVERTVVGATGEEFALTFAQRLALAPRAIFFYVGSFLWPRHLAFIYPRWTIDVASVFTWIPAALLGVALAGGALAWWRGWRGPLVLLVLVIVALFPALGFVDVWPFRYSYVADHFAYLATIPFAIVVAWLVHQLARRVGRRVRLAGGAALIGILCVTTMAQTLAYRDEETLWRASLDANPNAWMPWSNLAGELVNQAGDAEIAGRKDSAKQIAKEADDCARKALAISEEHATTWTNLSEALRLQGQIGESLDAINRAIALEPESPDLHWRRARLYEMQANIPAAIDDYRKSVEYPDRLRGPAKSNIDERHRLLDLARVLTNSNRVDEAIEVFETMLKRDPTDPVARASLARCRARIGDVVGARAAFRTALEDPPSVEFVVSNIPEFVNVLLAPPSDATLAEEARQLAQWLNDQTGSTNPLVLTLLARAQAGKGEKAAALKLIEDARQRAADAPQVVRDEIERRAKEIDAQ